MASATDKWYNLSEMARLTGINRAQLHKYVKTNAGRFTTKKIGRRTVFAESAVKVFEEIRAEGLRKVGKKVTPRVKASGSVRKKAGRPSAAAAPKAASPKKAAVKKSTKALDKGAKTKAKSVQPKKRATQSKAVAAKRPAKAAGDAAVMAQVLKAIKELRAEVASLKAAMARPVVLSMELKRK